MARPSKATPDDAPEQQAERFILKKNHGLIEDGRTCQFYAAGTEFDPATDAKTIAALVQAGAIFE
jgi:hypothetical protein